MKVVTPELSTHFDEDMVVLEKWVPKNQYLPFIMMEKKRYYIKRFLVEAEKKRKILSQNIQSHN
jgi:topoisomerase-4 subunit A